MTLVGASYDALIHLLESIESFLNRLDIVMKIMARPKSQLEDARCSGIYPCLSLAAASASMLDKEPYDFYMSLFGSHMQRR